MARLFYSLILYLATPLIWLRLLWRGRRQPEYLRHLGERWGFYRQRPQKPCLWVHAVSVGETRAAQPLVEALLAAWPDHDLLLTGMTPTGRDAGRAVYGGRVIQAYLPYDYPGATRRFLRHFRPRLGILMETEIWPNLLAAAASAGVPVMLANARLSERSARGYRRFGSLARPAFARLAAVAAQTEADAERLRQLGALRVEVCGNLKFDVAPPAGKIELGRAWRAALGRRPVWLAASTREGEESLILQAFARLIRVPASPRPGTPLENRMDIGSTSHGQVRETKEIGLIRSEISPEAGPSPGPTSSPHARPEISPGTRPDRTPAPLLVLVPRHPQRFDEVAALAKAAGHTVERRSAALPGAATQVWLGDSMGEMAAYYTLADIAFVGGSLLPLGGQNLIEAAACGCPVLVGPHTFNFTQATEDAIAGGAAQRVADSGELGDSVAELLADDTRRSAMAQAAGSFAAAHRGATARTLALAKRLPPAPGHCP